MKDVGNKEKKMDQKEKGKENHNTNEIITIPREVTQITP